VAARVRVKAAGSGTAVMVPLRVSWEMSHEVWGAMTMPVTVEKLPVMMGALKTWTMVP